MSQGYIYFRSPTGGTTAIRANSQNERTQRRLETAMNNPEFELLKDYHPSDNFLNEEVAQRDRDKYHNVFSQPMNYQDQIKKVSPGYLGGGGISDQIKKMLEQFKQENKRMMDEINSMNQESSRQQDYFRSNQQRVSGAGGMHGSGNAQTPITSRPNQERRTLPHTGTSPGQSEQLPNQQQPQAYDMWSQSDPRRNAYANQLKRY